MVEIEADDDNIADFIVTETEKRKGYADGCYQQKDESKG